MAEGSLRARSARSCGAVLPRSASNLDTAPHLARHLQHEIELAPCIVLGHRLPAAAAAREAALRRQAELPERHMLRRLVDAPLERILALEHRRLRRHEAEYHAFSFRHMAQRREVPCPLGVVLQAIDVGVEA